MPKIFNKCCQLLKKTNVAKIIFEDFRKLSEVSKVYKVKRSRGHPGLKIWEIILVFVEEAQN